MEASLNPVSPLCPSAALSSSNHRLSSAGNKNINSTTNMIIKNNNNSNIATPLVPYADDESRWQAVQARDAAADGAFVYCVRSTRIYCRPVCKARLARRANVVFHPDPARARAAGYRACKRCRPDSGARMPDEAAVRKIQRYIEDAGRSGVWFQEDDNDGVDGDVDGGDDEEEDTTTTTTGMTKKATTTKTTKTMATANKKRKPVTLEFMSKKAGLSKWHFHRVFKNITGMTPVEYAAFCRKLSTETSKASDSMDRDENPWLDVLTPGLSTPSAFDDAFDGPDWDAAMESENGTETPQWLLNDPPTDEYSGGSPYPQSCSPIYYAIRSTPALLVLVAFQDRKVCVVGQHESESSALAALEHGFPSAFFKHICLDEAAVDDADFKYRQRVEEIVDLLSREV